MFRISICHFLSIQFLEFLALNFLPFIHVPFRSKSKQICSCQYFKPEKAHSMFNLFNILFTVLKCVCFFRWCCRWRTSFSHDKFESPNGSYLFNIWFSVCMCMRVGCISFFCEIMPDNQHLCNRNNCLMKQKSFDVFLFRFPCPPFSLSPSLLLSFSPSFTLYISLLIC